LHWRFFSAASVRGQWKSVFFTGGCFATASGNNISTGGLLKKTICGNVISTGGFLEQPASGNNISTGGLLTIYRQYKFSRIFSNFQTKLTVQLCDYVNCQCKFIYTGGSLRRTYLFIFTDVL
jgi:hypothetical protein